MTETFCDGCGLNITKMRADIGSIGFRWPDDLHPSQYVELCPTCHAGFRTDLERRFPILRNPASS